MITTDPQALVTMPPVNHLAAQEMKMNEMNKKKKRFQMFGAGSFLYALC